MSFSLPNPTVPTNGQSLDATPVLANLVAIEQAIDSFDGSQVQSKSIVEGALADAINPRLRDNDLFSEFVMSGCVWSATTGLAATMTGGIVYVNGYRTVVSAIASHTFTASKDTYVDIDYLGNVTYNETTNGGTPPSITANSVRAALVVTGSSSVSNVTQYSWQSFTPTWSNLTVGNAIQSFHFMQVGKLVVFHGFITLGSSSSVGNGPSFSLPVAASGYIGTASGVPYIGLAEFEDHTNAGYAGLLSLSGPTLALPVVQLASGTYVQIATLSSTVPATWGTGDEFRFSGHYEAA